MITALFDGSIGASFLTAVAKEFEKLGYRKNVVKKVERLDVRRNEKREIWEAAGGPQT